MNIIDHTAWHGDSWDPLAYGREYDFKRPFFEQVKELIHEVPFPAVNNWESVNSDYCNFAKGNKNCYLMFGADFNEDSEYSTYSFYTKNSSDLYWVNKGEFCYELVDSESNYESAYGRYLTSCVNTRLGFDLTGCQECLGCINLRNQNHRFFNEKLSLEEYKARIGAIDLGSHATMQEMKAKFHELYKRSIFRPYRILNSVNSTGDNIYNGKNCKFCFDIFDGAEDCKYIFLAAGGLKDSYASGHCGAKSELLYDSLSIYPASNVIASWMIIEGHHVQHSINCTGAANIFGCVGMKKRQYCILNKQYSKEEYETLVPKIIQHMNEMPYVDKKGRVHGYGEFFPTEISPFAYNETQAYEYFPMTETQAREMGYEWKVPEEKTYNITVAPADLPDSIKNVPDTILKEVIGCEHNGTCTDGCTFAFKLIPPELALYKRLNVPLPRRCPNCRNVGRVKQRNPLKFWHRACACAGAASANGVYKNSTAHFHGEGKCPNEFETSYAPERSETVYCEQCYKTEVV